MKIALVGNPNSGKTTLFNALTGSTAHVGNWPGVTVDKRTGVYKKLDVPIEIVDLPGIYSLAPYSPEEKIAHDYLTEQAPDCVVNILDSTTFERSLYLTTQLLELDLPIVIALNMTDELEKQGGKIDVGKLEEALGVPVVAISALRNKGLALLMQKARACKEQKVQGKSVLEHGDLGDVYKQLHKKFKEAKQSNASHLAISAIEGDGEVGQEMLDFAQKLKQKVDSTVFDGDFEGMVADARYKYITQKLSPLQQKPQVLNNKSQKIDKVLTHKIWAIPIFFAIMLAVFHLTFSENLLLLGVFIPEGAFDIPILGTDAINSPGVMLFSAVEMLCDAILGGLEGVMPEGTWYTGLLLDGVLSGVFAVMSFVPQIMVLFLFLSILEDTGYMARVAFIMDRAFKRFGLSGKALMPLIMCFGCAVPGIMATRTLDTQQERKRAILLAPFFSCGAKLPIWAAFAGVFATAYAGLNAELTVFSMYILGILIAVLAALILNKYTKSEKTSFVMELPAYRRPQARNTLAHLWQKLKHYLFRAATVIAGAMVIIWFLSSFSFTLNYVDDSGDSIIGVLAKGLRYLFVPLGFGLGNDGWKFVVAALTGLIAKEMVVATMGTFAGMEGDPLEAETSEIAHSTLGLFMLGIGGTLGGVTMAVPAMFAFMAFNLLSVPCMAAVAAARGELSDRKTLWFAIGFWILSAYIVSAVIFWTGAMIAAATWTIAIVVIVLAAAIAVPIYLNVRASKKQGAKNNVD